MFTRTFLSRRILAIFVVFCFWVQPALACVVSGSRDFRQLLGADVIVVGSVVRYQFLDETTERGGTYFAEVQVRVDSYVHGYGFGQLRFVVDGFRADRLDALLPHAGSGDWPKFMFTLKNAKTDRSLQSSERDPLQLTLMNAPCAGAYMFEADSSVVEAAKFVFQDDVNRFNEAGVMARFLRMDGSGGPY